MDELKFIEELKELMKQRQQVDEQVKQIEKEQQRLSTATFENGSLEAQINKRKERQIEEQKQQLKDEMYQKIASLKNQINNEIVDKRNELEVTQNRYHKKLEEDLELNERAEQWEAFYNNEYEFTDKNFDKQLAEQGLENIEKKQEKILEEIQNLLILENYIDLDYDNKDFNKKSLEKLNKYIEARGKDLRNQTQQNPGQQNPGQQNPGQQNPGQQNPGQQKTGQQNPGQQAKNKIMKIELGKEPYICYKNEKGEKTRIYLTLSQVKKCMELKNNAKLKLLGQIDKDMAQKLSNDKEESLKVPHLDPVVIALLRKAKDIKQIDNGEIKQILQQYKEAIVNDKQEAQENVKKLLTYNRKDLDYIKISNMFSMLLNKKTFDKIKNYCMYAEKCADIKLDKPGIIAKLLFRNRTLELGNGKVYESRLGENKEEADENKERTKRRISRNMTKQMEEKSKEEPNKYMNFQKSMQINDETRKNLDNISKKYQGQEQELKVSRTYEKPEQINEKKMLEMGKSYFEGSSKSYKSTVDIDKVINEKTREEERQ